MGEEVWECVATRFLMIAAAPRFPIIAADRLGLKSAPDLEDAGGVGVGKD